MGILEKIADIEKEMARTQKNKATEHHLGRLKAQRARLLTELVDKAKEGGGGGSGFDVSKSGDARVVLIGFPSVGKSTLLTKLTDTESATAAYEFTTLTCIPGKIKYRGAEIQLLDLPGIIQGASTGQGRGRQVISTARTADLILMMLDATRDDVQREQLTYELESCNIRLNKRPPQIYFKRKAAGGLLFTSTCKLTHLSEALCQQVLSTYKIFNAEVIVREDCTVDEFIDAIEGNRSYIPCLYVYNKIDQTTIEEVDKLARRPHHVVISCSMDLNYDYLLEQIWEYIGLVRVYTKPQGRAPDLDGALVMRAGCTVEHVCRTIHRALAERFKYAVVYGTSVKFSPQRVGLHFQLDDEDVVQVVAKK